MYLAFDDKKPSAALKQVERFFPILVSLHRRSVLIAKVEKSSKNASIEEKWCSNRALVTDAI
jgi:hypothetical protein